MRKLIKLALIALGIRAFLHWRKRRREAQSTASTTETTADPADELRRKLAESRDDDSADEVAEPPAASVAERRADVHEEGRAALDEMKSTDES